MNNRFFSKLFKIFLGLFLLFVLGISSAQAEGSRQFVIIVDNSGSMYGAKGADSKRYSIQATKIINDLLSPKDSLSLLYLSSTGGCGSNVSKLVEPKVGKQRTKSKFDLHIKGTAGANHFTSAISTATQLFNKQADRQLLLIITDVNAEEVTRGCRGDDLKKLKKKGVELTGINIAGGNLKSGNNLFSKVEIINNSQELIGAVAKIYQSFIGGENIREGTISNNQVIVTIDRYVKSAYLVIAADGYVGKISPASTNPAASNVEKNYNGGGVTKGHNGVDREYKIIHLKGPSTGKWRFDLPELKSGAGYMLIQDYSVGIRFPSISAVAEGVPVTIKAKLFDELTKKDIFIDKAMKLTMLDKTGKEVVFTHDGNTFKAIITPKKVGKLKYITRLEGKNIDKKKPVEFTVVKGSWSIQPKVAHTTVIGKNTTLSIVLHAKKGSSSALQKPKKIVVTLSAGEKLQLKLTGNLKYSTIWKPKKIGKVTMVFSATGGNKAIDANAEIEVVGDASFGKPNPIDFGKLHSNIPPVNRVLDLSNAKVFGTLPIKIEAVYNKKNSSFEINHKGKWLPLSSQSELVLQEGGRNQWDVRLVVKGCPEGVLSTEIFEVKAWFNKYDGTIVETHIPVKLEIEKDPWIVCWWPYILGAILTMLLIWIIHCIRSPARFPSTFELLLAPESDLKEEGILYKILTYKGTRSGFCRDAQIYMHSDIRFNKSRKGAFIKFQARHNGVYIIALGNGALWSQRIGMDWEQVTPEEEILLSAGTIYRNSSETLFFQARNI